MLAFFMWAIGVYFNTPNEAALESQVEFQQEFKVSDFSHFHTVEVEEGEFIIIESEPEFEVELDWFSISTKFVNFKNTNFTQSSESYSAQLFSSKEIIPLYDLYCNWKFHLS
jgi:hypothetical protein